MEKPKKSTPKKTTKKNKEQTLSTSEKNKKKNISSQKNDLLLSSEKNENHSDIKLDSTSPFQKPFLKKGLTILLSIAALFLVYLFLPQPNPRSLQQNNLTQQGEMVLEFDQKMNKKSVEAHVALQPPLQGKWFWRNGKTLVFKPNESLTLHKNYRLELGSQAKNWYGKTLRNDFSFGFLVSGPPEIDFVIPYSISSQNAEITPPPLPVIDLKQPITVLFDQAMDWEAINPEDLLNIEPKVEGQFTFLAQRAFEFTPTQWPAKTTLRLEVPAGLLAKNGLKTQQGLQWQLKTVGQGVSQIHPNGQNAVLTDQNFEVTFNLPVKLDELRPGENVQLFPSNDFDADQQEKRDGFFNTEITYKPNDPFTLIFKPAPEYQPNTDYELIFKAGLAGLEKDLSFKFRTINETDFLSSDLQKSLSIQTPLESLPAGFAPKIALKDQWKAPLNLQLCKLATDVNPLFLPGVNPAPCSSPPIEVKNVSPFLDLKKWYPQESWENAIYWFKVTDVTGKTQLHHLLLSDTTLILKRAGDDVLVWALDRLTQQPVSRLEVRVYGPDGKELGRGVTDGSGIYKRNQPLPQSIYVMGLKQLEGENRWSVTTDQWPLELNSSSSAIRSAPEVYLITDRNQMAPGQTLKLKGLWRTPTQRGYSLPWWGEITLKLLNQKGQPVFSQVLPLKEKASFDAEISLPAYLPSGLYQWQGFEGEKALSTFSNSLKVEQPDTALMLNWIKKPDFNLKQPHASVQLTDTNGLPGAAQKGQWNLYQHNPFNPLHTQLLAQGEFEFNSSARADFNLEWGDQSPLKPNQTYSLQIETLDQTPPLSLVDTFEYRSQQYPIEIDLDDAILEENSALKGYLVYSPKQPLNLVKLQLHKQDQNKLLWEREIKLTESNYRFDYNDLILPDLENGIYEFKVVSGGNDLSETKIIYVAKDLTQPINENLAVFLSHENKAVNTKSKLLLNVPEASMDEPITVLLSYEQAGLLDYDVIVAEQPLNIVEFNVQPSMNPGVYISALTISYPDNNQLVQLKKELRLLYQKRDFAPADQPSLNEDALAELNKKIGELELQRRQVRSTLTSKINSTQAYLPVQEDRKDLNLKLNIDPIEPKKGRYRVVLQALDEFENPTLASVSLMIRPKVHFFLSPMEYFLSLPPFNVSTYSNLLLNNNMQIAFEKQNEPFKNLIQPFVSTPYLIFEPLLTTNEAGQLSYEFTLPKDNLNWELVAFANTQENQWGSARLDLPKNINLKISPILPSVLTVGDSTSLGIEIHNPFNKTFEGTLRLQAPSLLLEGDTQVPFSVSAGEKKTLFWPIKVIDAQEKELKVTLNNQVYSYPLTIHSALSTGNSKTDVFAWLHFSSLKTQKTVTEFSQGKIYRGQLNLLVGKNELLPISPTTEPNLDPLPSQPLKISLPLPAGLKVRSWLSPLNSSETLAANRQSAELKGANWLRNPLWLFENIGLHSNQIELSTFNLPAGMYQFDFEVQAVWPGHFKVPALNWGGEQLILEEAGSIRVE